MSEIALGGLVGLGLGLCFHRGRICYASALSDFFLFRTSRAGGGILLATLLTMLAWSVVFAVRGDAGFWLPAWGWFSILGGVVFGVGMILAGACLTSTLWRAASGHGQYLLVLVSVGVGFVLTGLVHDALANWYFTPLWLGSGETLYATPAVPAPLVAMVVTVVAVLWYAFLAGTTTRRLDDPSERSGRVQTLRRGLRELSRAGQAYLRPDRWRSDPLDRLDGPWDPRTCGIGIATLATVWLLGSGVWTVSGPVEQWLAVGGGLIGFTGQVPGLAAVMPAGVTGGMAVVGGFVTGAAGSSLVVGDFSARPPRRDTAPAAAGGGLLMGVGASIAPGCNVTNLYTGVASLSVHGLFSAAGIVFGAYLATRVLFGGS